MESATSADQGERKSKRRKLSNDSRLFSPPPAQSRWTTEPEQRAYSSKLLEALYLVRGRAAAAEASSSLPPPAPRSRAVREAADRVLALGARGRTRWSRAILRVRIRAARIRPRKPAPADLSPALKALAAAAAARGYNRSRRGDGNNSSSGGGSRNGSTEGKARALQKKAKVLSTLVPGCRKLSLSALLDETSDYIAALQMQVRAMTVVADVLSSYPSSTAPATGASLSPPSSSSSNCHPPQSCSVINDD